MRIDLYTKTILTLIALLLAVIALKPIIQSTPALAQTSMSGLQFTTYGGNDYFFDQKTGDIWMYRNGHVTSHSKLTKLGAPWVDLPLGQ
jgi:hypothetical protein